MFFGIHRTVPVTSTLTSSSPVLSAAANTNMTTQMPTIPTIKIKTSVKKAKLVSTMLRQRSISQAVYSTSPHIPATSAKQNLNISKLQTMTSNQKPAESSPNLPRHVSSPPVEVKTEPMVSTPDVAVVCTSVPVDTRTSCVTTVTRAGVMNTAALTSVTSVTSTVTSTATKSIASSPLLQQLKRPISVNSDLSTVMPVKRHKLSMSVANQPVSVSTWGASVVSSVQSPVVAKVNAKYSYLIAVYFHFL